MSDFYSFLKSVSESVSLRECTFLFGLIFSSYNHCSLCSELSKCVQIMLFGVVFITKTKKASSENNLLPHIFTMGELWNIIQTDSGSYGRTFNLFFNHFRKLVI